MLMTRYMKARLPSSGMMCATRASSDTHMTTYTQNQLLWRAIVAFRLILPDLPSGPILLLPDGLVNIQTAAHFSHAGRVMTHTSAFATDLSEPGSPCPDTRTETVRLSIVGCVVTHQSVPDSLLSKTYEICVESETFADSPTPNTPASPAHRPASDFQLLASNS